MCLILKTEKQTSLDKKTQSSDIIFLRDTTKYKSDIYLFYFNFFEATWLMPEPSIYLVFFKISILKVAYNFLISFH